MNKTLLRDRKRWWIKQIDELDDGELDEQKCIRRIGILPGPTKKWLIKRNDELNEDELDEFYCTLNFVARHGAVLQPASINIVSGCKQAQQYGRTHQLSFMRVVGRSAQNACALAARAYHSYCRTLQFSCISYEVWVTARFDVLFNSLNVTKTINTLLAHFRFFKKATNLFNALGHHACSPTPTKISIDILLPAAKTFGLKLA